MVKPDQVVEAAAELEGAPAIVDRRRLPDPFYQDAAVALFNADCREVLPFTV